VVRNPYSELPFQKFPREAYFCRAGKTTSKEAILAHAHERNDAWRREVAYRTS